MELKVIARIYNDFDEKFGIPRQSGLVNAVSRIVFEPEYRDENAWDRGIFSLMASVAVFQAYREGLASDRASTAIGREHPSWGVCDSFAFSPEFDWHVLCGIGESGVGR